MNSNGITKDLFAKRDNDGSLTNEVICHICNKTFIWTDGVNSEAIVKSVSVISCYNREDKQFNLKVTAKCPHCNYRAEYDQYYKEKIK